MQDDVTKPILIAGLGVTGKALLEYFIAKRKAVYVVDDHFEKALEYIAQRRAEYSCEISLLSSTDLFSQHLPNDFEIRVISPGISPSHPVITWIEQHKCTYTSELELALQEVVCIYEKHGKKPIILGITGTNGKTTTVELVTHLVKYLGKKAEAYGNIGRPLIELLTENVQNEGLISNFPDVFVIEMSSYQIERMDSCLFTSCAWLNIAPDHLEWHSTFEAYKKAKEKLLSLVAPSEHAEAVLHESLGQVSVPSHVRPVWYCALKENEAPSSRVSLFSKNGKLYTTTVTGLPKPLQGEHIPIHEIENYLAAAQLVHGCGFDYEEIAKGYSSFQKGPHRIQKVACIQGTDFGEIDLFDDSKGTNIHATLAAVQAIPTPIVLIAGGVHKGHPYTEWAEKFPGIVHHVITIGQAKDAIRADLSHAVLVSPAENLQEAVEKAIISAKGLSRSYGKASVLLSPGCSSFDMFRDYKDRGEQFQKIVHNMVQETIKAL